MITDFLKPIGKEFLDKIETKEGNLKSKGVNLHTIPDIYWFFS